MERDHQLAGAEENVWLAAEEWKATRQFACDAAVSAFAMAGWLSRPWLAPLLSERLNKWAAKASSLLGVESGSMATSAGPNSSTLHPRLQASRVAGSEEGLPTAALANPLSYMYNRAVAAGGAGREAAQPPWTLRHFSHQLGRSVAETEVARPREAEPPPWARADSQCPLAMYQVSSLAQGFGDHHSQREFERLPFELPADSRRSYLGRYPDQAIREAVEAECRADSGH